MSNSITFNLKKIATFSFAALAFCLYSEVSFAQEGTNKPETDMVKSIDKPATDISNSVIESNTNTPALNKVVVTNPKFSPIKKENGLVGEGKKPEPAPSTLNFNIFLYIVDKFKAD